MYIKSSTSQKFKDLFTKNVNIAKRYMIEVNQAKPGEWGGKEISILFGKNGVMERLYGSGKDPFRVNMLHVKDMYRMLKTERIIEDYEKRKPAAGSKVWYWSPLQRRTASQYFADVEKTMAAVEQFCEDHKHEEDFNSAELRSEVESIEKMKTIAITSLEAGADMARGAIVPLFGVFPFAIAVAYTPFMALISSTSGLMYYFSRKKALKKWGSDFVKVMDHFRKLQSQGTKLRETLQRSNKEASVAKTYDIGENVEALEKFFQLCKGCSKKFLEGTPKDKKETPLLKAQKDFAELIAKLDDKQHCDIAGIDQKVKDAQAKAAELARKAEDIQSRLGEFAPPLAQSSDWVRTNPFEG